MHTSSKKLTGQYGAIIFLMLFYTIFHIALTPDYWDDASYRNAMDGSIRNLLLFLHRGYLLQTSRTTIELVTGILSVLPYSVWKLLNLLIILLLYEDIVWFQIHVFKITDASSEWAASLLLCSLPFSIMASAGWLATTLNYLWVISLGWYAVNKVIKAVILEEKLSFKEKILTILTVLYSGCFESVTALMSVGILAAIFYEKKWKHKKAPGLLWVILAILLLFLVEIAICPGNQNRMKSDVGYWMADYAQMNLLDKLRMGIVMAFMHFVSIPSPIFFILNASCLAVAIMKKGTRIQKLAAACPVALDILWTCYFMINYLLGNKTMTYQVPNTLLSGGIDMIEQLAMLATIAIWFASLLYTLYWAFEAKKDFFLCLSILLTGCVPEVIVGMSATVTNSMLRTVIYLYLSMILIILCLLKEIRIFWTQIKWFRLAVYFTLACGIALNAMQMTRHILVYG